MCRVTTSSPKPRKKAKQPNNYVTYGSDTVQERDVAFLCWTEDGICYSLLDQNILNPDTLFAMAGDLIQQ